MNIESYILRFLAFFGLIAASITTITEVSYYGELNPSLLIDLGAISTLIGALVLIRIKKVAAAGVIASLTLGLIMAIELYVSAFPRQGSIAVFLVLALANSTVFHGYLRIVMQAITLLMMGSMLYYIHSQGYVLPDGTSFFSMMVNLMVIYCLIAFATYKLKSSYDKVILDLNSFNTELEAKVESRTRQLIDYSVKNSHEVRAPLTRILSILELSKKDKQVFNEEENIQILDKSANELDGIIKEVNLILNKEKNKE